jgi:YD repeat-containing protein
MAKRTKSLMIMPWNGGLVTSKDEALLEPSQLTQADNIALSFSDEKRRREGINYDWDDCVFQITDRESAGTVKTLHGTFTNTGIIAGDFIALAGSEEDAYNSTSLEVQSISGTELVVDGGTPLTESLTAETALHWANKVVGGVDFWFGSEDAKAQYLISVLDNGAVYYTASGGAHERLTDTGTPWTGPLTEANCEVVQNKVVIAVSGLNNVMKYWDGDVATTLTNLPSNFYSVSGSVFTVVPSVSRESAGTTRTLIFNAVISAADLDVGDRMIVTGGPAAYNGVFNVASRSDNGTQTTYTYTAGSSLTEATTADTSMNIGTDAPLGSMVREHAGALWCNDKTHLDRVHYSGADIFSWGGRDGVSGATDIGDGDGDPSGVTGISPTFKGLLFIGKRTKLYRIDIPGGDFDLLTQTKISNGIGFVSHQSVVAVEQDDLFFVSDRGIHSLAATDAYGDVTAAFISNDIQRTFVNDFEHARKRYIKAAYLPEINSALFSVSMDGSSTNNALYLFNIQSKAWYRWPDIEAEALIPAQDTDRRRVYLGTYRGRLAQTQTSFNRDVFFNGETVYIRNRVATGLIYPEGRPDTTKAFKSIRLIFKAAGSYTITCKVKIDNFSEQAVSFVSNETALPLGTMVLGSDVLGGSYVTAPHSLPVDGHGRGIKLTFEQNDLNTALALQGFIIEYWSGDTFQEVRFGDDR